MSYKKQFHDDPRQFMQDNIVTCPDNPANLPGNKIVKVTIEAHGAAVITNKPDGAVYVLTFADEPDSLDVYWCPYYNNDVGSAMLGTDADYVFTVSMNACSFGVGSYAAPGVVRVAHANSANSANSYGIGSQGDIVPAMTQQAKVQRAFLYGAKATSSIIAFDDYMICDGSFNLRMRSTTFGELSADRAVWKFYTLQYVNGMTMEHKGVVEQF